MLFFLSLIFYYIQLAIALPVNDQLLNSDGRLPANKDGKSSNIAYLPLPSSWTNFYFTNTRSYGSTGNPLQSTVYEIIVGLGNYCIQVADLFCAGDEFTVYGNVGISSFVLNSTVPGAVSCDYSSSSADYTIQNATWSSFSHDFSIVLPVPVYFTVYVTSSPFSAGQAAIRLLDSVCLS